MRVPFLDLKAINLRDRTEFQAALDRVLDSGWLVLGQARHCARWGYAWLGKALRMRPQRDRTGAKVGSSNVWNRVGVPCVSTEYQQPGATLLLRKRWPCITLQAAEFGTYTKLNELARPTRGTELGHRTW